jgi:hypothetical protein
MKTIIDTTVTVKDGIVTMTGKLVDRQFGFPTMQQTVPFADANNARWMRHIQISQQATFVKAFGNGFGFPHEVLVKIATACEPKTSYPPVFKKGEDELVAEISSEIEPTLQWEVSDGVKESSVWKPIEGQTSRALDKTKVTKGQFVRLVATSEAGQMISNPVLIK